MSLRQVSSPEAPPPSGGYSQGIAAGDYVFLSGQGPFDPQGAIVSASVEQQVRQVFANLDAVARSAGASLESFVRVGVYLSDMAHFDEMDRVYCEIFAQPRPARTTIHTNLPGFIIEADAVAVIRG